MSDLPLDQRWRRALQRQGANRPEVLPEALALIERFGALAVEIETVALAMADHPGVGAGAAHAARQYALLASGRAAALLDREADLRRIRDGDLARAGDRSFA